MHSSVVIVAVLLCIASAIAQPAIPDLPNQFQAKVTISMPFLGQNPGAIYYDYINSRVRYDVDSFFGTSTSIQRYDIETPTEYDIAGGQCQAKLLNETMNSMAIPPFANYQGSEDIDSVECDHWNVDFFGISLDWWVSNSTGSDGKVTYELVRWSESAIGTQIDFTSTVPGPVDYSFFDVSSLGCTPPPPAVTYSVAGYVKNAINNKVIPGASVQLGSSVVTADSNGRYQFDGLAAGNYAVNASADGFYVAAIQVTIVSDSIPAGTSADFNLSPALASGQFRAVLTWAAQPADLDAHIYTPNNCQVYYGNRACGTTSLDVDQRQGFGPETITINGVQTGTYRYFVVNYSGEKPLTVSNGRIQVYGTSGLLADFNVPTNGNTAYRYWNGFTIDQTGTVTVVNQIVQSM